MDDVPSDEGAPSRLDALRARLSRIDRRRLLIRAGLGAAALVLLAAVTLVVAYRAVDLPAEPEQAETSVVLDAEGNTLAELFDGEHRVAVRLEEVAEVMRQAVVAAEDRNFYEHSGLDPVGVARALWNDVRGKELQGGSTITQQLVKNTYLSPERTLTRKAREAILAVKVERSLSKDAILERYLNTVYFGRSAYGVETAARAYFGVAAADLTLPQAALLAGLIRAPERAEPATDADAAEARRSLVLRAMEETGVITAAERETAEAEPLGTVDRPDPDAQLRGSTAYFVAQARRWAVQRYGERVAFGGGLRIHTTLRPAMQQAAERAVFETLNLPEDPDAALVALDENGGIVAMIGGRDYQASKVNLALGAGSGGGGGRQPGSTFKPFVLASAFEAGIHVTERFPGPRTIEVEIDGQPYEVSNYGDEAYGDLDLVEATARSVNTVYAQLGARVGMRSVVQRAHELGIDSELRPFPALTLGTEVVAPLEMARAFMTFGNRGERVDPYYVTRVTDVDGSVVYSHSARRENVMARQHADLMNHVLRQTIERGTGRAAAFGRPAAGKTGTTQDYADAWFVGYTPRISAAVWMGYKEGTDQKMTSVHGRAVTGGSFPAQIWSRFMAEATAGMDTGDFNPPPDDLLQPPIEPPPEETTTSETTDTTAPEETTSTTEEETTTTTTTSSTTTTTTTPEETSTTTTTSGGGGGGGNSGGDSAGTGGTTTTAPP